MLSFIGDDGDFAFFGLSGKGKKPHQQDLDLWVAVMLRNTVSLFLVFLFATAVPLGLPTHSISSILCQNAGISSLLPMEKQQHKESAFLEEKKEEKEEEKESDSECLSNKNKLLSKYPPNIFAYSTTWTKWLRSISITLEMERGPPVLS